MKKAISTDLRYVTFSFDDGVLPVVVDCDKIAPQLREYALPFAVGHRCGDNAAIPRKGKDGAIVTVTEAMRRDAVAEMADYMQSGATEWNMKASARTAPQNPTILAIAAKRACTYAEAEAFLAAQFLNEMA